MSVEIILSIVSCVVILLLVWIVKLLAISVEIKSIEVEERIKNNKINTAIYVINEHALNIIYMLNQTVVDSLREDSNNNGKLDAEDIALIKTKAYNTLNNTLSQEIKDIITDTYTDLDIYLNNVIEKSVVIAKANKIIKIDSQPLETIETE